jgi:GTP-binding protein
MRREGFELQVSQPHVIIKEENGQKLEPFEELTIDVPSESSGTVIEKLSKRKGIMMNMKQDGNNVRLIFEIPTRGLLGYRGEFVIDTKGEGILCTQVIGFRPHVGEIEKHDVGSMVSMLTGKALAYTLYNMQDRGTLYIDANTEVYEGMVVGNVAKGNDLSVNVIKGKHLTNMRASGADEAIKLTPPLRVTLERGLEIMKDDEFMEVTPKSVRLRKKYLTELDRTRAKREGALA